MRKKKSLEDDINDFLNDWGCRQMCDFIRDILPLFELYDVDEEDDWMEKEVGKDNLQNVRLIRTVYLMSKISENHAGRLCALAYKYKGIWKKMEKQVMDKAEET